MATAFEQVKAIDAFGSPADVTAALLGWLAGVRTVAPDRHRTRAATARA